MIKALIALEVEVDDQGELDEMVEQLRLGYVGDLECSGFRVLARSLISERD